MADYRIALLIDMDNIVYASENFGLGRFQINPIMEILKEKGRIIIKRAYADWIKHSGFRFELQNHAIDLIELPQRGPTNKNSTDIKMVVDAMDVAFTMQHIDTFAFVTGDKDFFPLITKLREHNFQIIGFGVRESTSDLIVQNCDEFIYYNNLVQSRRLTSDLDRENIYQLLTDTIQGLVRDGREKITATLLKKTILRKSPDFHEGNFGFKTFASFLRSASRQGLIDLFSDPESGSLHIDPSKFSEKESPQETKSASPVMEDYNTILNSVGLRPGSPDSRKKILQDIITFLTESQAASDLLLSTLVDETCFTYEQQNVKISKSSIRDIVRMMMYIGCFKDARDRWIASYSVPIAKFNTNKTLHYTNLLCMVHILKYDTKLTDPAQLAKILFGSSKKTDDVHKLLDYAKAENLIIEKKTNGDTDYKVLNDRYFLPWK